MSSDHLVERALGSCAEGPRAGVMHVRGPVQRGQDGRRSLMRRIGGRLKRLALRPFVPRIPRPPKGLPRSRREFAIGIYDGPSPLALGSPTGLTNPVLTRHDVTDTEARFVADPFLLHVDGSWYMFFELLSRRSGRGEIALATSPDGRTWRYDGVVLAEEFHLSYPYVFAWDGRVFMVPESYQAGGVRLYEARRFPREWRHVKTLLRGPFFVDASPFRWEGRWWMFAETSVQFRSDTLRLFHADDLRGRWREHPASPILQGDPHRARPAGRVVVDGGALLRFAQDCEPAYGLAVSAFRITELTPGRYHEERVGDAPILGPGNEPWNRCGMHHVDPHPLGDGRWLASVDGWFAAEPPRLAP